MDDQFRVRYFYTTRGENPSQNEEKEYDKQSPVESIVLWYIARNKLDELQNFMKLQGISVTRESDGIKIALEKAEMEKYAKIMLDGITYMLIGFAQEYSYTEVPERLRRAIISVVQSDPPDALKTGHVVLVSNKIFGLVGHKELLDDTKKVLIKRAEDLQIYKETVDIHPAHGELVDKFCVIETLQQKHQVQINLTKVGEMGNLNITGAKENVQKCIAEYNNIVSPASQDIPQTWVDLLKNEEVQDYIQEELRRANVRCVWRIHEHDSKVLVYSLESKTSREACTIICESVGEETYPAEISAQQEVQSLLKRHERLLNISELYEAFHIVGVRKIMESIDDVFKHDENMQRTHQHGKFGYIDERESSLQRNVTEMHRQDQTGNKGVVGHYQVKNETGKYQHTGNTDVIGQSQAQSATGKYQQTGNTDFIGQSQAQSATGKYKHTGNTDVVGQSRAQNETEKYQHTGNTDVVGQSQAQSATGKYQHTGNTDVIGQSRAQNETEKYQHTGNTDVIGQSRAKNETEKYQQDKSGNTDIAGQSHIQNETGMNQQDGSTYAVEQSQVQNETRKYQQTGNTDVLEQSQTQNETRKYQQTGNTDVWEQSQAQNEPRKYQQTGNTDVLEQSQAQNETRKYQQTGNTDVLEQSQAQNEPGKYQQDKSWNIDIAGQSQVQNVTGISRNEWNHQQMPFHGTNDNNQSAHTELNSGIPTVKQLSSLDQQTPATSRKYIHVHKINQSSFDVLQNIEIRAEVERRLQEAQLKCPWQVQTKGHDYYLEILSDNHIVIKDLILQIVEESKSEVSKPASVVTEVRVQIDNDKLIYIQEHKSDLLKSISERYGVRVHQENNDEFVITDEMESLCKAKYELMTLCKGIVCCSTDVETDVTLLRPEVRAKLRELEREERCVIEFPAVHTKEPRCLYSWMYSHSHITITITCGPVENSTADIIVLPVNALGDIIGDSDNVRQVQVDQNKVRSKFTKEQILFLPNSSTLDCRTIALAYVPEWTHKKQIDDDVLRKFDKLLKYAIDKGIRSVVIPIDVTEAFPFSTFGYKLVSRFEGQQRYLSHSLEIFLCTRTVHNGYVLKSKLKKERFQSNRGDKITEVLFGIEQQFEIRKDLYPEKAMQIHVQSESLISMQSKVDVIVNSVGRDLKLEEGYVSKSLLSAAGASVQDECTRNYPNGICYGDVAVTESGQLQCKMLCHGAILRQWIQSGNFSIRVLKSVLRTCLVETEKRQFKTIAMPAVGTGKLSYPYHRVAEAMFDAVEEYQRDHQNTCITDVFFVIHQDDKKILEAFKLQEKRDRKRPKKLHKVKDDQTVEFIECFLPGVRLRFQIFQHTDVPVMNDKPEAVVTFNNFGAKDQVVHKWNADGNYLHIVVHYKSIEGTFKKVVKEVLEITEENMITSVAFKWNLNSFVTKSPVNLAELVKEIIHQDYKSKKPVYHYIRQIQFVVNDNTDIRDFMPSRVQGVRQKSDSFSLDWHFVSYTIKSNQICRVLAEDEATVKRVQDEVRRLIKQPTQKQTESQVHSMRDEGLRVNLLDDDYKVFRFFAGSTSWYRALENCAHWEAGSLRIQPITDASKQKILQLVKEIKEMNTLDFPLAEHELDKASDVCSEVQKEFQDVYLCCELKDGNVTLKSSSNESILKVIYKLDLSFGRIKVTVKQKELASQKT